MLKHVISAVLVIGLVFSFAGCKKQEEKPQLPAGHPGIEGMKPQGSMPKVDRSVVVPKEVQATWKSVKLKISDKNAKSSKEYTVNIGSEIAVPNSDIAVKVLAFMPHFMMGDQGITSASNKPENPAAQVVVTEKGKEIWKGWLYSKHPEIHPFEHAKVGIVLLGGVSK